MHSTTFVLLEPPFVDLRARADALLAPHRIDEENYKPGWRFDYYTSGDDTLGNAEANRALGIAEDDYLANNVCFVKDLAPDVIVAAIVTPDGVWHDVADHGWRGYESSADNLAALEKWRTAFRALFAKWQHCVAIEFDTHS